MQHGSKYFAQTPPPSQDPAGGVKRSSQIFQNIIVLNIKLKAITKCSNMVANITLGFGSNGKNSTLSEHGHVAYQIKGKRES